jgi:hypothetical protein
MKNMVTTANSAFAEAELRIVEEDAEISAGQFRSPVLAEEALTEP